MLARQISRPQLRTQKRSFSTKELDPERRPVIVSAVRTPVGAFNGKLSSLSGDKLGSLSIKMAVDKAGIAVSDVQEAILGNVLSAGMGQAPARQAALGAGLLESTVCTTINKVCSSGMKSVGLAAQSVMLGQSSCVVAGGFESMTNAPFYLPKARSGYGYGHGTIEDAIQKDGLTDAYNDKAMGWCAEQCAEKYKFSREDQDNYAVESYRRANDAIEAGKFKDEIIPINIPQKKGDPLRVDTDEEPFNVKLEKVPKLRPVFQKDGTVTAANASSINDGAASIVVMSEAKAKRVGAQPIARILGMADAEQSPVEFTTAPAAAIPKSLKNAGVDKKDVDFYEINEAFSVVSLANLKLLDLDPSVVNVNGGAVALGHPIGCSGARILVTLLNVLKQNDKSMGVAGICNGGGGASSMVVERM
eukprot:gb/GECH01011655.1/.p1 GENE.gb/GECH01011655.1/~~gb/GECH01011655.1/.p1  ORF type:complete len:418 (+),score=104.24 gb/GECH01011655.1/:1-1254(+)